MITALHVLRASCFRKNATQTRKRVSQTTFMDSRCLVLLGEECVTSQRVFYTLPYRQDDARTNYRVSRFCVIYRECKNDRIKTFENQSCELLLQGKTAVNKDIKDMNLDSADFT